MAKKKDLMKNSHRKQLKNAKSDKSIEEDRSGEQEDTYDIEASDDELNETPPKWYDEFTYIKLPKTDCNVVDVEAVKQEAEVVLNDETHNYRSFLEESKKSETKWMMTMAKSGTSTDKVAALALMVQESPVHNLSALSSLVNMAKPSKKHQFMAVLDTLTELFINDLLRPAKKLKKFQNQPVAQLSDLSGDDNAARRKRLCYWLFEDQLKTLFATFVTLLNTAAHDSVQSNREKAIGAMLKLLLANREQEDVLMCNLINKFGDPVHKVASRVVYGLEKVAHKHPNMREKILDEVEKMLFRSNISKRAQYYGICFLSQYKFSGSADRELCKRLITLYFSFFKACVKTGDIDSKLMGALLVGVNRAFPYASRGTKTECIIPMEHIDTMYKVVHFAPFKIGLQALSLLLQITNNDRYYNTLYRKLFDKEILTTSHQAIWLNLMIKSIRKDQNENRKKAFVKRILQISLYFPVPLLCGTLIMISQVLKHIENVSDNYKFNNPEEKQESEMPDIVSNLRKFEDDNDDEKVFDVEADDDETEKSDDRNTEEEKPNVGSSWFHRDLAAPKSDLITEKIFKPRTSYDPTHRNPSFAGGEKATFVELIPLATHYHPTVSLFARKIIADEKIHYTGDPLKDFTMLHFLERFSFKNPKKNRLDKGEDRQELFRAVGSERKHYNATGMRSLPVQSDLYLKQSESAVPVDELFLYKYLKEKKAKMEHENAAKPRKKDDSDDSDFSDVESVGSVEFNDYLDNLLVGKHSAEDLDFAADVDDTQRNTKSRKVEEEEEDDDSDDAVGGSQMNDEESDDEEDAKSDGSELNDDDDDDEMSVEDFSGGSDDEEELDVPESENDEEDTELPFQSALRKRISRDFGNIALPVEQFSEMLEEAGKTKSGGAHDILNKDKSNEKQLKWEASRVKQRWRNKNQQNSKPKWKQNKADNSFKKGKYFSKSNNNNNNNKNNNNKSKRKRF